MDAEVRIGYTLSLMAKNLHENHAEAISAEGLYRSSLTYIGQPHLKPLHRTLHVKVLKDYSKLIGSWDKRQKEADDLMERANHLQQALNQNDLPPIDMRMPLGSWALD